MVLSPGASMWLPCKVKPGPFSDERMVLVDGEDGEWFGFVNTRWLKKRHPVGEDEVLARVVTVDGPIFRARIPGEALQSRLVEGRVDRAMPSGLGQA